MRVASCYKVLAFIFVAILSVINFAKADKDYNYERYEYPDYVYPGQSSMYSFSYHACTDQIHYYFWGHTNIVIMTVLLNSMLHCKCTAHRFYGF